MNGSQYHLNHYQINFMTNGSSPKNNKDNIQENLERLSYLLGQKENKKIDSPPQYLDRIQEPIKKVFVNLRGYIKTPNSTMKNSQEINIQNQGYVQKPQLTIKSQMISKIQTPQTQTPVTIQEQNQKKLFMRPQSMGIFDKYLKNQEKSSIDTTNLQSERMTEISKLLQRDSKINKSNRSYNSWVGLSVIERNRLFLERKQAKLQKLREIKDEKELSKCTFAPQFYNQIKNERPSSCQNNKSYQDIYKLKKSSINEQLY